VSQLKELFEQGKALAEQYKHLPANEVVLKLAKLPFALRTFVAEQIQGYKKAKTKIPSFCENPNIIFPPKLNLEQSSSELTALWKAENIIRFADTLTDLTGGWGIDAWAFSKVCRKVMYVEQNETLANIAKHNFEVLACNNIEIFCDTASNFLTEFPFAEWIYLDPARRDNTGKAIAQIGDCQPNVLELLPTIFQKTKNLLLKASPMLDIQQATEQLGAVQKVWAIAVENDCKELLFYLNPQAISQNIEIEAVNIQSKQAFSTLQTNLLAEKETEITFSQPQKYLYEPNVAILKAGLFRYVGKHFGLAKLHPHTHFYTHQILRADFQGRIFEICDVLTHFDWKSLQKMFPQAHLIARNYPLSVEQIRKQSRIQEGDDICLIFTTWHQKQKGIILAKQCLPTS